MTTNITISDKAALVAKIERESTHAWGYHVQQLLDAETQKLISQVHECGAMLQARNEEIEQLKQRVAFLEGRIVMEHKGL